MSFNISEVADDLGIEKLQDTGGDSIPICCPYCGDRRGKNTICIRKDGKEKNVERQDFRPALLINAK